MAFYEARWFSILKNFLIGIGAGFIIIGALFKIMHWPGANEILVYAMFGEAGIFFLQALIPPHKDYHWEKVFPGVEKHNGKLNSPFAGMANLAAPSDPVANELNKALDKAGINKNLIGNLGKNLESLESNLKNLGSATKTAEATNEYSRQAKEAAKALANVKTAYASAANVATDLSAAGEHTKKYQEQVQAVSKNLAALNAVYELELQDTNNHLKALNKFYGNLTKAIDNLNESVDDTKKYRQQMANLNKNLTSLNNIYGNMLNAMATGRSK